MTSACSNRKLTCSRPRPRRRDRSQVISKQRPAARAIDQDVARLEHRDRVLRRQRPPWSRCTGFESRASIRSLTERSISLSWTEPARPSAQQLHQVGGDRLPEREALRELRWVEDGLDVVPIEVVGTVALDRIGDEVRGEPDHAGARVLATLLVETHGEASRAAGAAPSTGGRRVPRRGRALGLRNGGSRGFRHRIAGASASSLRAGADRSGPRMYQPDLGLLTVKRVPGPGARNRRRTTGARGCPRGHGRRRSPPRRARRGTREPVRPRPRPRPRERRAEEVGRGAPLAR